MNPTLPKRLTAALSRCCSIAFLAGFAVAAQAQSAGIATEAQQLLKASTERISSLNAILPETSKY